MVSDGSRRIYLQLDVQRIRRDFPVLEQEVQGKPLIYLDSAATSQKPRSVVEALRHFYEKDNSNVHRGVHALTERATAAFEAAREKIAGFIDAPVPEDRILQTIRGTVPSMLDLPSGCAFQDRCDRAMDINIPTMATMGPIIPS